MPVAEEDITPVSLALCECTVCEQKRGRGIVPRGILHDYSSMPRGGWRARRTTAELEAGSTAPTFGVELETTMAQPRRIADLPDRPTPPLVYDYPARYGDPAFVAAAEAYNVAEADYQRRNREHLARQRARFAAAGNISVDEAVGCARSPRGLFWAKHDSSVTGPEFASQPCTLAYWRQSRRALADIFTQLLHGGVRSHDGDRAGLHVNIGSDAFADASHLERFMALVAVNPRFSTRMSQRTNASMSSWANLRDIGTPEQRRNLAAQWARYGSAGTSHSSAVNLAHVGRVEFRMPRGTLRLDRFYAKIEWAASMVEYTRDASRPVNVAAYVAYVEANRADFPELYAMLRERFAARFDGRVAA